MYIVFSTSLYYCPSRKCILLSCFIILNKSFISSRSLIDGRRLTCPLTLVGIGFVNCFIYWHFGQLQDYPQYFQSVNDTVSYISDSCSLALAFTVNLSFSTELVNDIFAHNFITVIIVEIEEISFSFLSLCTQVKVICSFSWQVPEWFVFGEVIT